MESADEEIHKSEWNRPFIPTRIYTTWFGMGPFGKSQVMMIQYRLSYFLT